jgi:rSAM/selenodomain-associated transferase 2
VAKSVNISIIVPVLNEGAIINDLVEHLHIIKGNNKGHSDRQTHAHPSGKDGEREREAPVVLAPETIAKVPATEIIVVDGDIQGSTIREMRVAGVTRLTAPTGRATQMNAGAAVAVGEILLFLHADTRLPFGALNRVWTVMKDSTYVGGSFDLGIRSEKDIFRLIERVANVRSRLTRIPFGDQAIFLRADYFQSVGCYREIPIMEDVDLMRRIERKGDNIFIIPERVETSARRWESEGVLRCTLRNWVIQMLFYTGVSPAKLATLYTHP